MLIVSKADFSFRWRRTCLPYLGDVHVLNRSRRAPLTLLAGSKGRGVDGKSDTNIMHDLARTGGRLLRHACTCHAFPGAICMACGGFASYGSQVGYRRATWGAAT